MATVGAPVHRLSVEDVRRMFEVGVLIEIKLNTAPGDDAVRHLHWLSKQIGDELLDAVIVTTGDEAYRRSDGIAVVPAALLGP